MGAQARAVIDGLGAHVVTLAIAEGIAAIAARTDRIPEDWQQALLQNSSPCTSTIVLMVRWGKPPNIEERDDPIRDGIEATTPNPINAHEQLGGGFSRSHGDQGNGKGLDAAPVGPAQHALSQG